jgi:hypothetical protein
MQIKQKNKKIDLLSKVYNIYTKTNLILAVRNTYHRSYLIVISKKNLGVYIGIDLRGN